MAIFIHNAAGPYTNAIVNSPKFTRTGTHRGNLKVRVKSAESGTNLNTLFRNSDNIYVLKDNSTAANDWKLVQRIWVKVNPEDQDNFSRTYGVEGWRLVWDPEIVFTRSAQGVQNFTIPYGVEKIYARLWGAGGHSWFPQNYGNSRPAGNGGYTEAVIDLKDAGLTAGDKLQVVVGHSGAAPIMSQLEEAGGNTGGGAVPKRLDPRFMAFLAPYGGGGMRTRSEQNYGSYWGGGCSAIFRWDSDGASAGLESRYWPNYYGAETSAGRGDGGDNRGGGRFYTNPNHVGGTGAIFKVNNVRSSSDAETLQLSMDANVLAVASGGGGGKLQQANRPPHGGGLTAGFAKNESGDGYPNGNKRATNAGGGSQSHSTFGPGQAWWGGSANDHHCDAGGGSGWYGGGQGEYSTGGGVGYLATERWGVTGKSYVGVNYLHPENTNNALQIENDLSSAFTWHGDGAYGEEASHPYTTATYFKSQGLVYPPHANVIGYWYGRALEYGGGHGLVTIKFRPYTVEPEGINGIIPGQDGAPLTVSGGGPNGEHYEWPRRSGDWYFDPDSQ
tara:strand:- start:2887 stop:4557 length:1671 start_codon:yes stop_codon:yes gene_type:complete